MRSMTAFAELNTPLEQGHLHLRVRSVNHKGLELSLRVHPALYSMENSIRAVMREAGQRGKVDLCIEVQDDPNLELQMNRPLLRTLAKTWQEDAEWLHLPPFTADAFFRVPGAWLPPASDLAERLEAPVMESLRILLDSWNKDREREAQRLKPFFVASMERLRSLRDLLQSEAESQAADLPGIYRQRLDQILKDAQSQGQLSAERIVAEAGALAERQDVREEVVRLSSHLDDFAERLEKDSLSGKWMDVWAQEILRELNTCGSKCKRLAMTKAVMEAKGVLDQIREQGANLE